MLLLVLAGLVVVVVAFEIVSRQAAWDDQTNGMVLAVAGAMLAAYGVTSWLVRARSLCASRRGRMFAVLDDPAAVPDEKTGPALWVVAHPDSGRYHRPDCALAAGQGWPAFRRADVDDRRPCGVCAP
jgi:hypothetical protein